MRSTFSRILAEAAKADDRLLLLTGDHGYALFDEFRQACPDRFLNCGVAEQNMVGVAAGLAKAGFRPVVYGLSSFVPMRVLEQIKMDVCYESLPVMFVGDGAGVVYSQLGASHQCTEDVSALRAIPNIEIFSPADRFELESCFSQMKKLNAPSYLRFGKADCGDVHKSVPRLEPGHLFSVVQGSKKFAFIATGAMVSSAVQLSKLFGLPAVWSAPYLSALNEKQVIEVCSRYERVFTFEEHSIKGGLGSAISEIVSQNRTCAVTRFGINMKFSELCGDYAYLMDYHGLSVLQLQSQIQKILEQSQLN